MATTTIPEIPAGYVALTGPSAEWRVGHAFSVSNAWATPCWVDRGLVTIRPGETSEAAMEREWKRPIGTGEFLFVSENV